MKQINGIILSGGQSLRMGEDKALLKVGNRTIIETIIYNLKPFCDSIIISSDNVEKYSQFGYKVVPDKFEDSGPLAGIYSSLLESDSEKNFIISCDLPLVSSRLIEKLIETKSDEKIILPTVSGKYYHLCGIYSKSVLSDTKDILEKGKKEPLKRSGRRNTSIKRLLDNVKVEFVDVTDIVSENEFLNMNTKEDFAIIEKLLSGTG